LLIKLQNFSKVKPYVIRQVPVCGEFNNWRVSMGLAEKRAIKEFQDTKYPDLIKEVHNACSFEVTLDIQWETLSKDGMAHLVSDAILKVYFQPIIGALKEICADDMGKEALRSSLKKIQFCNTKEAFSPAKAIFFVDGVLSIDHQPFSNIDDVADRRKYIVKILENAL